MSNNYKNILGQMRTLDIITAPDRAKRTPGTTAG